MHASGVLLPHRFLTIFVRCRGRDTSAQQGVGIGDDLASSEEAAISLSTTVSSLTVPFRGAMLDYSVHLLNDVAGCRQGNRAHVYLSISEGLISY